MKSWVMGVASIAIAIALLTQPAWADKATDEAKGATKAKAASATIQETSTRATTRNAAQATQAAHVIASFEALDRNADGQISRTEAGYDRQLAKGFAFLDTNGDGFLSLEEFAARDNS